MARDIGEASPITSTPSLLAVRVGRRVASTDAGRSGWLVSDDNGLDAYELAGVASKSERSHDDRACAEAWLRILVQ
jgi:hypothetical protein